MSKTATAEKAELLPEAKIEAFSALARDRWQARQSGVFWNEHEVVPEALTPFEHLLKPEYWANVASRLKPGDTIIAMPEDAGWRGELVVWAVGHNWAHVAPLYKMDRPDFGPAPSAAADEFEVGHAGPVKKYRVIRKSDRRELKAGFDTPADANRWIADYTKAIRS